MYALEPETQREVLRKKRNPIRLLEVQAGAPLNTTLYWGTCTLAWQSNNYDGVVIKTGKRNGNIINIGESIPSQHSFSFTIADSTGYYSSQPASTFLNATVTLRETFRSVQEAVSFVFRIRKVSAKKRGELSFDCTDLFSVQNYPNIPRLKINEDLFPYADQSLYGTNVPIWYGYKKAPCILIDKGDPDTAAPSYFLIGAGFINVTSAFQRERLLTSGSEYVTSAWSSTSGTMTLLKIINPELIYDSGGSITDFIVTGTRTDITDAYTLADPYYYASPANVFFDLWTNEYYGLARSSGDLDATSFFSAAYLMKGANPTVKPIYFNCRLTQDEDFKSLFSNLLFSSHCWMLTDSSIQLYHNPNTSSTSAFDETNIIQTENGEQSFSIETRDISRVYNTVKISFEDKDTWSSEVTANPGPSIVSREFTVTSGAGATSAIGVQDQGTIHSKFIGDSQIADRIGYLHIQELANAIQDVTFTTHLVGKAITPLDLVPVSWDKCGLSNQLVRVTGIENDEHTYTITGYTAVNKTTPAGSLIVINTNAKPKPSQVAITSAFGSFSQITFAWVMNSDVSVTRYHFQVATNPGFSPTFIDATTYGSNFTFTGAVGSSYYFQIKAVDVFGQESTNWTSTGPVYAAPVSASDLSVAYIKETYIDMNSVASPYIAAGNAFIQGTLKIGTAASAGAIQSYNYNGVNAGWQIAHNGTITIFGNPGITNADQQWDDISGSNKPEDNASVGASNYIADATFALTSSDTDDRYWEVSPTDITWQSTAGEGSTPAIKIDGNSGNNDCYTIAKYPIGNGDRLYIRVRYWVTATFNGTASIYLYRYRADGTTIDGYSAINLDTSVKSSWVTDEGYITISSTTTAFFRAVLSVRSDATTGSVYFTHITVTPAPGGADYIKYTKITSTSVESPHLVGNSGRFFGVVTVGPTISTSQGITISSAGIWHGSTLGHASSKFGITSAGDAYFKGNITASTGTFNGDIFQIGGSIYTSGAAGIITINPVGASSRFAVYTQLNQLLFAVTDTGGYAAVCNYNKTKTIGFGSFSSASFGVAAGGYATGSQAVGVEAFNTGGSTGIGCDAYASGTGGIGCRGSGPATGYDFRAVGAGTNYGTFTGAHEVIIESSASTSATIGMICSVTGEVKVRYLEGTSGTSISSTLPKITLSNTSCDVSSIGVFNFFSSLGTDTSCWVGVTSADQIATINALGEGRVLVTNINGEPSAGDYITTSNIQGYGQKQDDDLLHSYTVGKITENVDWSSVSASILHDGNYYKPYLIACIYTCG